MLTLVLSCFYLHLKTCDLLAPKHFPEHSLLSQQPTNTLDEEEKNTLYPRLIHNMRFSTGIRLLFLIQYQTQAVKAFSVQRLSSQTIFAQNQSKHCSSSSNHRYIQSFPRAGYSPSLSERNASISKDVEMSRLRSQNDRELSKVIKEAASSCLGIAGQSTYTDFFGNIPFVNTSVLTKNKEHRVVFILGGPGAG